MPITTMRFLVFAFGLISSLTSCSKSNWTDNDNTIDTSVLELDNYLRFERVEESQLNNFINRIESNLINVDNKKYSGKWTTNAYFKSNSDSSITLIKSKKEWDNGFKREIIIHVRDSLLFIKHFEVLTENKNPFGYELLEIVEYLNTSQNLLTLIRRQYPRALKDTIEFRKEQYITLDLGNQPDYHEKLNYARTIMQWN